MSDDKGSVAMVNVVKPTLNESPASQSLEKTNHTTLRNSFFLPPCTPPELLAALSKEIEPFDQFTESFGTVNKYGETILFELSVPVCNMYEYRSYKRFSSQSDGKVTITFYPEKGKVFVIVKRNDNFWPSATTELLENTEFDVDGWAVLLFGNREEGLCSETTHSKLGYVFEVQDSVGVRFSDEKDLIRFKNVIRNVQARISMDRLQTNDLSKRGATRAVSEFWFQSALRPYDLKLLFLHKALIWKIKRSEPATIASGFIAIAQYKVNKSLQLITFTKDTKMNCELSEDFTLIASDISSETNYIVWEWFVRHNERNACGFKTAKEASVFKITTEYYLNAWKKRSLFWDW